MGVCVWESVLHLGPVVTTLVEARIYKAMSPQPRTDIQMGSRRRGMPWLCVRKGVCKFNACLQHVSPAASLCMVWKAAVTIHHSQKVETSQMFTKRWRDHKMWHIHTMGYKNEALAHATTWWTLKTLCWAKEARRQWTELDITENVQNRQTFGNRKQSRGCQGLRRGANGREYRFFSWDGKNV